MADLNQTTTVTLTVNGLQAEQTLNALRDRATQLGKQMTEALRKGDMQTYHNLRKEFQKNERDIRKMQTTAVNVENVLKNINKASLGDLERTLKALQRELRKTEQDSPRFTQLTEAIRNVKTQIQQVKDETNAAKQTLQDTGQQPTFFSRISKGFDSIRSAIIKVVGAYQTLLNAVTPYADMEEQMAETRKFTGMTAEEVGELNEAFKQMDTRTSREQLNKLAQEAGRLGKSSVEEVRQYVEAADVIHVALNDLGEGATETVYKLASIFHVDEERGTRDAMLAVGSAVNTLSQNSVASASYLVDFSQRMAGVGATARMSVPDILAYASTLSSAGQQVEQSSSALGRLVMKLYQDPQKVARTVGLDVKQFTDTLQKDTNAALLMLLERFNELGKEEGLTRLAPMFKEMGANGVGLTNVLTALADNIGMVREQQRLATQAFEEANSVQQEFAIGNATAKARLEKHKNELHEVAVALGEKLMPVMDGVIRGTTAFIKVITTLGKFLKDYGAYILTVVAAIGAYTVVVKASAIAEGIHTAAIWLRQKALLAAQRAQIAFNAAAKANPWGLMAAAIAAVVAALAVYKLKHKELTAEQKLDADIKKQVIRQYGEEKGKIDLLNQAVHDETRSLAERRKALNELRSIVPGYHAELTDEGKLINDNHTAIEKYCTALKAQMALQAYQDKLQEAYNRRAELDMQAEEKQKTRLQAELAFQKERATEIINMGYDFAKEHTPEGFALEVAETALDNIYDQLTETDALITHIEKKISSLDGIDKIINPDPQQENPDPQQENAGYEEDKAARQWRQKELALLELAYQQGDLLHKDYARKKLETERDYYRRLMAAHKEGSTEYLEAEAAYHKAGNDLDKQQAELTIQQETDRHNAVRRILIQHYADGQLSQEQYQDAMEKAQLEHLRQMTYIYKEGTEDQLKAQEAYQTASAQAQEKHLQETRKRQEKMLELLRGSEGFPSLASPGSDDYEQDKSALAAVYATLTAQAATDTERLALEEAYQQARYELARRYNDRITMDTIDHWQAAYGDMAAFTRSKGFRMVTSAMEQGMSAVKGLFSQVTDYLNAELQLQTADVEARYDAEIKAAGDNAERTQQLEERKQAEISKLKSQAADKQFRMQLFTAIAEGAMAAINAWSTGMEAGFPAGMVLAPVLMALSLATTGVQIAAISKQKDAAAATGYASGGYTRKGRKDEPAGIVHAGEWVASQELLQNPESAAVIAALDHAQKTHTIASLHSSEGLPSLTHSAALTDSAAHQHALTDSAAHQHALTHSAAHQHAAALEKTLARLDRRLREPFVTVATVEGDLGIKRAQDRYNRLTKGR